MKEKLVTVILLAENSDDNSIIHVVKNVKSQTHKNIDLIISTFRGVSDELKQKCRDISISGIRWINQEPKSDFFKELIAMADGDIIFYKTMNNIIWYPRHIQAHVEDLKNNNAKWGYSHVEYRDLDLGEHPYNAISYRVTESPDPTKVSIDEICHYKTLETDWNKCLRQDKDGNPYFVSGFVHEQWVENNQRGSIPKEITLVNWVKVSGSKSNNDFENYTKNLGKPKFLEPIEDNKLVDGDIVIERKWPTIVGNVSFEKQNKENLRLLYQTEKLEEVKSIAIKRTMGMGDVLLVEPIIKKMRQKYPNAEINFYTSKPDIVKYFQNKPDNVNTIEENLLLTDHLGSSNESLCFDLDISYESRTNVSFVDAYATVCDIEFENQEDKHVSIDQNTIKKIDNEKPIAVVCGDGSGWAGKTWPLSYYEDVIEYLQKNGYYVIETGKLTTSLTPEQYHDCSFETMMSCLSSASLYVGTDNGPMHIARGLNVPCVIVAGAALPYYSNPNRKKIYYVEDSSSETYGIKHRFFIRQDGDSLSFVPPAESDAQCGLGNINSSDVIKAIKKITKEGFSFNMTGSIVKKDIIQGFAYYDSEYGLERENKYYHPDQRVDLSQYYEDDIESYYDTYLSKTFEYIESVGNKDANIFDVGCNMGILLNKLNSEGYNNISGIDINTNSISKAKNVFEEISDKVSISDALSIEAYGGNHDIIVAGDIVSKVNDPLQLLSNVKKSLSNSESSRAIVSLELFDTDYIDQKDERLSIGENINLFSESGIKKLFADSGFSIDTFFNEDNGLTTFILK